MIRVLIVDDHGLVRAGLRTLLTASADIEVVGEAADGVAALSLATDEQPDVVLMDLSMPVLDGVATTRQLTERLPDVRVVALMSSAEHDRVNDVLSAGAVGYLLKDRTSAALWARKNLPEV